MTDLDSQWASHHVEALADRSLSAKDERRMRAAMARNPELSRDVRRAAALRRELRALGRAAVPLSLCRRLLDIPAAREPRLAGRTGEWGSWASAAGAAVMVVAALLVLLPQPDADDRQRTALREFEHAMAYLERSSMIAREQVEQALAGGLRKAIDTSRKAMDDREGDGG